MTFIRFEDLAFSYPSGPKIFNHLSMPLIANRVVGLLGASGAGKTTLLRLIADLEKPIHGAIEFSKSTPLITFVFQEPVLFEAYSRLENARYRERHGAFRQKFSNERFDRLAQALGLDKAFLSTKRPLQEMSGGERQRLVLLRELSIGPDLILLDEPCTGLDPQVKREFLLALGEVLQEIDVRCIYATHHLEEVLPLADEILYLSRSTSGSCIVNRQSLQEFLLNPPTLEAAITAMGPLVTILSGSEDIDDAGNLIDLSEARHPQPNAVCLAIPPESVTLATDGFSIRRLATSGTIDIVSVHGQRLWLRTDLSDGAVLFMGPGLLFRDRLLVDRVVVTSLKVGTQWRLRVTRQ
jgi:ABC-type multidrug transport system ATPase subunit